MFLCSTSFMHQIGSSGSRILQLHFEDQLPSMIFTGSRVESEDCSPLKVVLRDSTSGRIITSGPLSTAKVNILVLDGDFNSDDREDWGEREFTNKSVREREGKRPLLTGTLSIALREGVGYMEDVTFTDNSSWIRCGKFRLGAKLQNVVGEASVREGISNAFKVKDHRGECKFSILLLNYPEKRLSNVFILFFHFYFGFSIQKESSTSHVG